MATGVTKRSFNTGNIRAKKILYGSGKYFVVFYYVSGNKNICARMKEGGKDYKEIQAYYRA